MITEGLDHIMYFRLVSLGLPKGVDFIAEDKANRKEYLKNNPNFPNNIVLIPCITYCENILNDSDRNSNKWINDYGGIFTDILLAMKIIRNAWSHNNGNISDNNNFNGMNGNEQYEFVKHALQLIDVDRNSYNFSDESTVVNVLTLWLWEN